MSSPHGASTCAAPRPAASPRKPLEPTRTSRQSSTPPSGRGLRARSRAWCRSSASRGDCSAPGKRAARFVDVDQFASFAAQYAVSAPAGVRCGLDGWRKGDPMPRLSARQVEELRQAMLAKRSTLLQAAHAELDYGERSPYAAVLEEVADEADRATAATTAEFDNEIARRHGAELRDVDAALARIAGHRYG